MDEATAQARLERKLQWETAPALTVAEVDDLLSQARVADANGVEPDATGYVATYTDASLDGVAGEGWLWKAGKASASFDIASAGDKLSLKQQYDMCMAMAASYGRVTLGGGGAIGGGGGFGSARLSTATSARTGDGVPVWRAN